MANAYKNAVVFKLNFACKMPSCGKDGSSIIYFSQVKIKSIVQTFLHTLHLCVTLQSCFLLILPECLTISILLMFQAFQDLLNGPVPRLEPQNTDVEPYVVDGVVYLARLSSSF